MIQFSQIHPTHPAISLASQAAGHSGTRPPALWGRHCPTPQMQSLSTAAILQWQWLTMTKKVNDSMTQQMQSCSAVMVSSQDDCLFRYLCIIYISVYIYICMYKYYIYGLFIYLSVPISILYYHFISHSTVHWHFYIIAATLLRLKLGHELSNLKTKERGTSACKPSEGCTWMTTTQL